ncbi:S-layer homology domain-containing protein [Cohnella yongneupensis]|uniref:S-layer homology domain-containing protein n=1 Tax=Cohnella yongneupensis TaxID=425006 RepID=A0ABW0QZZ5_9BACL
MRKISLIWLTALLLLITNATSVFAMGPVAEVYYNTGTSVYQSSDFEARLTAAIKTKLDAAGINPKYVSIMDASATPISVTDTTYVHSGYNTWYGYGYTPQVVTPDYNHVQITNNNRTLSFYGYDQPSFKDFMLTSGSPSGKKIITFDMDESKASYHSMEGGGFLFNSEIDSQGKLSGYAILYLESSIKVFRINGVDATAFHEKANASSLTSITGITSIATYAKGTDPEHTIKINATDTQLNMWDNGQQIITNFALPQAYGNEFGPIVSYLPHSCEIISIFTYDNLKLFTTTSKSLEEAVDDIAWEPTSPYRYVIDINDDNGRYVDGGTNQDVLKTSFNQDSAQYVSVTNAVYQNSTESFVDQLTQGGLFVDSGLTEAQIIEAIANQVVDNVLGKEPAILAIEAAEATTTIGYEPGDSNISVTDDLTLVQDDNVTTVWSSDQPSVIAADGTVTRPVISQPGTYVTLTATITKDGLTSERTFTVYVLAAEPEPLTTLSAVSGDGQVTLNFPALVGAADGDITVEMSTDGTTFTPVVLTEELTASSTSATISGLTNGATYYFRLNVESGMYEGVSNTVDSTPVKPVTDLTATAGYGKITLNFPALTGTDSEDIVVEMSTDGITFTPVDIVEALNATSTKATINGLDNSKTYSFRLNIKGGPNRGISNVVEITTLTPSSIPDTMETSVTVTDKSNGGTVVHDSITKVLGDDLGVTAKIVKADGTVLNLPPIKMNENGTFTLPKLPAGEYTMPMTIMGPNGEHLAGPVGKLTVGSNGVASLQIELVDPYGTILDMLTGQPMQDVTMRLYWADTESNRSKGKTPGTLVDLPELVNFLPNKNHNPQVSTAKGEYGWMVYADGDYYFTAEKDGYVLFDSRNDKRDEKVGVDSHIKNGVIHVGESIVQFNFPLQAKVKASGVHSAYMLGYPDGSFKPKNGITRSEVAAILERLYAPGEQGKAASYSDVSSKHWAANAIAVATQHHWMVGTGNDKFEPNRKVTRAEFAQLLTNLNKWKAAGASGYSDTAGHWADSAIAAAKQAGALFDFTGNTFSPNNELTRLEAVRIFNTLLARQPWHVSTAPLWTDVSADYKYYSDIMEASTPHDFELYTNGYEAWNVNTQAK